MGAAEKIEPDQLPTDRLWTPEDCATYFRVVPKTFTDSISKMPRFPEPKIEHGRRLKRWLPADIIAWGYRERGIRAK